MFEREQWQHVENPIHCLVHYSDKMENHPLLFERGQWQRVENLIHCLVKQQWKHMEFYPLLTKCALKVQEKLHPLMFEREQWYHVENHIHCLVLYSDKMENYPLLFERGQLQRVENHIHCLVKQQWQHMEIIHCLLNVMWQHMENNIHCSLKGNSGNLWKIISTAKWNSSDNI